MTNTRNSEELQRQIAALEAQLAAMQSQQTPASAAPVSPEATFTVNGTR
jgi:hypothetical protein